MVFQSDNASIDQNNIELVCLYIKDYRGFSNELLSLNAKYKCSLDKEQIVITETNYKPKIDDFTNMHLICGMNGTGKSKILEMIRDPSQDKGITLILKCGESFISNNKRSICFVTNGKQCKHSTQVYNTISSLAYKQEYFDVFNFFHKEFLAFYVENKKLFSDIDEQLITHFIITEYEDKVLIESIGYYIRRLIGVNVDNESICKLRKDDLCSFLFYSVFTDQVYEALFIKNLENKEKVKEKMNDINKVGVLESLISIRKVLINGEEEDALNELINELRNLENNSEGVHYNEIEEKSDLKHSEQVRIKTLNSHYPISDYQKKFDAFDSISNAIDKYFNCLFSKYELSSYYNRVESLYYFRPAKIYPDKSIRYLNDLSQGELASIKLRHDMYNRLTQPNCAILLEDEPNSHFHPEWSRNLVLDYANSMKQLRKYIASLGDKSIATKKINIILTTHSPLILSDFYNEEVLFLKKEDIKGENGEIVEKRSSCDGLPNCFAGNIAELLLDNFFLKSTIGAFAESKIKEVVRILTSNDRALLDENKETIEATISKIGDSLIRTILEDQAERAFNETN